MSYAAQPPHVIENSQSVRNGANRNELVQPFTNTTTALRSHPGTARRDVDAQTPPSTALHSHPGTARCDVNAQTAPSISVVGPHPLRASSSQREDVPAAASSPSCGRGVIDRARVQPNVAPDVVSAPPVPFALNMPDTSLGFITDIENENDLTSFLSGGIGEENDEDGDADLNKNVPGSEARVPFPEWFQKRVKTLLDELKDDRRSAGTDNSGFA
ncbi:hypothetical protein C8R44DRAFT_849351 [Mycena epipterygia]|nr:hypothetical protein C8R44DRAFT_849351 [Mycena epipterygia]